MDSKNLLLTALFAVIGLGGCQTLQTDSISSTPNTSNEVNPVAWEKGGEIFRVPVNNNLTASESRVVFFRNSNDTDASNNINIGVGSDNVYQTSLQSGHYSDAVICSGSQIINVGKLHKKSGKVIYHSQSYQFTPQTTTYLQVGLSEKNNPIIKRISADKALPLLNQSVRQTHQISRVSPNCNISHESSSNAIQTSVTDAPVYSQVETKNPTQFNVLFDFDSTNIKNNDDTVFAGMANFIQAYPKNNVILEGHTDNRGSNSYNLKLSQSRADTVKGILVDQYGLEAIRLQAIGYGESAPIDTNDTEQGRQNNRRVVATINDVNN